jgi:acetolactate synthase small subunit
MNRKRRLDTVLLANYSDEMPLFKKRKIVFEEQKSFDIFNFVKSQFDKIHEKLEQIEKRVNDIDNRLITIEMKLDKGNPQKILNFIKEMEQLKIESTPPKFIEPCPYIS